MIKLLAIIMLTFCLENALAQRNFNIGMSLGGAVGIITDAQRTADLYNSNYISITSNNASPRGLWSTTEIGFDAYFLEEKLQLTFGLRMYNWSIRRDSINWSFYDSDLDMYVNRYGNGKLWTSSATPNLGVLYRIELNDHLNFTNSMSFGYLSVIHRYAENTTALDESNEGLWDESNLVNSRPGYQFDLGLDVLDLRIFSGVEYCYKQYSLNAGLAYYYVKYRNVSHNGLYLKMGISLKFLK